MSGLKDFAVNTADCSLRPSLVPASACRARVILEDLLTAEVSDGCGTQHEISVDADTASPFEADPPPLLEFEDVFARAVEESVEGGAKNFNPRVAGDGASLHNHRSFKVDW